MINDENTADLEQLDTQNQEEETNEETHEESSDQSDTTSHEDEKDWKAEALKYKAILDRNKGKTFTKEPSKKSDEVDYGVKAYLKTSGIDESEFDFVSSELKKSGLKEYDKLLSNPYFKSELENKRALLKTQNATIRGKSPNGVATDSVEYWMSKDFKDVPANMKAKVVNARMAKEKGEKVFYNS